MSSGNPRRRRRLRRSVLIAGPVLVVLLAASGLSAASNATRSGPAASHAVVTPSQAPLVAQSARLITKGARGILYYPGPEEKVTPANVQILKRTDWRGPTSAPKPQAGKKVIVLGCFVGSACEFVGNGSVEAGKVLGWNMKIVNSATGTPASFNQMFSSALAEKPDAIIAVAIPSSQVGPKIAEAKKAGVKLVAVASNNPGGSARNQVHGRHSASRDDGRRDAVGLRNRYISRHRKGRLYLGLRLPVSRARDRWVFEGDETVHGL